jgi:hypothetical protein
MENDNFQTLLKFFLDEFEMELLLNQRKPADVKEGILITIFNRLNDIVTVMERIKRYDVYFENFYPENDDLISEAEAIEYHLHSYLQDFYSLSEKINRLIGYIKNNIKHFEVGNPDVVKQLLEHLLNQVGNGLKQVNNLRGDHVHDMSVRDSEISRAKLLKTLMAAHLGINEEEARGKYKAIIEETKQKYVGQAQTNTEQLNGMRNFIAPRLGHVIAFLYEKDSSIFEKQMSQN